MRVPLKRILITAGPTREKLDPVRYLSNESTGEMGYAIAREARRRGSAVTLITGPVALAAPAGVKIIRITSAAELEKACRIHFKRCDALFMTAAVCDFRPQTLSRKKIKRAGSLHLRLEKTNDILAALARHKKGQTVIGFCLETQDWLVRARRKIRNKRLDGIVANRLTAKRSPFGPVKTEVALLDGAASCRVLKRQPKTAVARRLLDWVESLAGQKAVQKR